MYDEEVMLKEGKAMKRFLVILLAALLLLSFTSCNQDKIEELEAQVKQEQAEKEATVKNYEDFVDAFIFSGRLPAQFTNVLFTKDQSGDNDVPVTLPIEYTETSTDTKPTFLNSFILNFITLGENESLNYSEKPTVTKASGKIKGTITDEQNMSLTFEDNSYTVTYKVKGETEERELKLELSGTYAISETETAGTVTLNVTINKTKYDVSYTMNPKTMKFSAAKVNGENVNLNLANKIFELAKLNH